jgi:two-component system, OmpR family, phosphate regulon sensor histidine kinase PhoR
VSVLAIALTAVAAVLAMRLAYHALHLTALRRWLRRPELDALPRGRGVWEEALAELHGFLKHRDAEHDGLAQSLTRFRAAVRALPDGVVILDREHRIEWSNPTAAHHLGIDPRRDLGQPVVNLIRHPDFVAYLAAGDFREPMVLRARDTTLSLQLIEFGEEQKLLNSRDVTADERLDVMRRDFVANVSHELKTPVTVLAGFVETLLDESFAMSAPQRSRYLGMMAEQATRM